MPDLLNAIGECQDVLMTIQPSDDCYHKEAVGEFQYILKAKKVQAVGYEKGYVANYLTKELREWNPNTSPPFYTIKFPRKIFMDPHQHMTYTGPLSLT